MLNNRITIFLNLPLASSTSSLRGGWTTSAR
jgi:hypothetical protein